MARHGAAYAPRRGGSREFTGDELTDRTLLVRAGATVSYGAFGWRCAA
jgi:hypothetical protein